MRPVLRRESFLTGEEYGPSFKDDDSCQENQDDTDTSQKVAFCLEEIIALVDEGAKRRQEHEDGRIDRVFFWPFDSHKIGGDNDQSQGSHELV